MSELSPNKIYDLLGTREIPGSEKELEKLCIRMRELVDSNGEDWVKENRLKLLDQWEYIVRQGIITGRTADNDG